MGILKNKFLIGATTLTGIGFGVSGYFSVKSLVFENFWDNKIFELEKNIEKLSDSDYENVESSLLFIKVKNIVDEILSWLEEKIGKEKFENIFLKLLGYENLPEDITEMKVNSSKDGNSIRDEIKTLKDKIKSSESDFYKKLKQLSKICQEVIRKFESLKKSKVTKQ